MITQRLTTGWQLRLGKEPASFPAPVPGTLRQALLAAGRLPEPNWRDSAQAPLPVEKGCVYTVRFIPQPELLEADETVLCFHGVQGAGEAALNGSPLGWLENLHRVYEFPVTHLLHPGENTLELRFPSQSQEALLQARAGLQNGPEAFPWLPDLGPWRAVELAGWKGACIQEVRIRQTHQNGQTELSLGVSGRSVLEADYTAELIDPQGNSHPFPPGPLRLTVDNPQLWWPRGYGDQPLYTLRVRALDKSGRLLDLWERSIGLRTVALSLEEGQELGFAHVVNGVKIFAMGAVWLPEDVLPARRDPARTRRLLEACAAAGFNCLRVWGGGVYPEEDFYDLCDQLGLLVWQDLMFCRPRFQLTGSLRRELEAETEALVKRLRHHPCLGLWCGSAGGELQALEASPRERADYIRLLEYSLPLIIQEQDPQGACWPSSPSSGGGMDQPEDACRGDSHGLAEALWQNPAESPLGRARYVSALGLASYPCLRTLESFTEPGDRNPFSYVMDLHGGQEAGEILGTIQRHFLFPTSLDTALYASQLAQAEEAGAWLEHLRRNRGRCMGALLWHLNEWRPGVSCASVDYTGRWKPLHYRAKRAFAPLLLSCQMGPGNQAVFCLCNETRHTCHVLVKWALRDRQSRVKREETVSLSVGGLQSAWLDPVDMPEAQPFQDYVSFQLYENGRPISLGTACFVPPKYYRFLDPELSWRQEGEELVVSARAYARGIELQNSAQDLLLSDNDFDMLPGERRLRVLAGETGSLRLRSMYDVL